MSITQRNGSKCACKKLISYNCFPAKGPLCPVGLNLLLKTLVELKSQKLIYCKNSYLPKTIPVNNLEFLGNYCINWWTRTIIRCIAQQDIPKITRQQQFCNLHTEKISIWFTYCMKLHLIYWQLPEATKGKASANMPGIPFWLFT